MRAAARANSRYLREPRRGFFNADCRTLIFFRLGLEITKVPLPRYSALNNLSSAKPISPEGWIDPSLYRALFWNTDGGVSNTPGGSRSTCVCASRAYPSYLSCTAASYLSFVYQRAGDFTSRHLDAECRAELA